MTKYEARQILDELDEKGEMAITLSKDDFAWNPISTHYYFEGPVQIHYTQANDGSVSAKLS